MRREVPVLLSSLTLLAILASGACGARTGLEGERIVSASDAQTDGFGDAQAEADAPTEGDAPIEAGPRLCPLTPPMANGTCPVATPSGTICIYVTPPKRVDFCCLAGGWVNCTTVSGATETCSQVLCTPSVPAECIESSQCCFCDTPTGTVSQCGPC